MQEGVNDLVEQLRVAVVVPPPLEAAFRLVPRSAFLVSHAVSLLHTLHISNSHTLQLKHCWHVVCSEFHHVIIWVSYIVYFVCISKLSRQSVAYCPGKWQCDKFAAPKPHVCILFGAG